MFTRADIVIGYHGAGAINGIFSKPGTRFIEISTFINSNNTIKWRSNKPHIPVHQLGFEWFTLYVPFNQTTVNNFADDDIAIQLNAHRKGLDMPHYFKDVSVTLSPKEINTIVALTVTKLKYSKLHSKQKSVFKLNKLKNIFHGIGG